MHTKVRFFFSSGNYESFKKFEDDINYFLNNYVKDLIKIDFKTDSDCTSFVVMMVYNVHSNYDDYDDYDD